jgi:hypothetical protein
MRKAIFTYLHKPSLNFPPSVSPTHFLTCTNCKAPPSHPLHMFIKQCLITNGDFTYVCMYLCMYGATGWCRLNVSLVAVQNLEWGRAISTGVLRGFCQTVRANTMTAY